MIKETRMDQIREKTLNLIVRNGSMDSVRTKDIAAEVGASEATMFKYFDSKNDIFESVIKKYIQSRPLKFEIKKVSSIKDFEQSLHKILDFTFDTSSNRNKNVSLIIQTSLKKHPISNWNYENLKNEVWSFLENRIEYGKKHWNFAKSIDSKIQSRLFYYAPIMFYIQMEIFDGKSIEKFDYEKVKKIHVKNFIKLLTENSKS
jgi:AcrR family transcriptional regulator